jgi:excisionase family DNA binding protein
MLYNLLSTIFLNEGGGKLKVYTVQEVAEILKISEVSLRKHIRAGKLRVSKIGRHYRISEEQLREYLEKSEVKY